MKARFWVLVLVALVAAVFVLPYQPLTDFEAALMTQPAMHTAAEGDLAALAKANAWLNSPALTPEALRGKVVLVNFWTYTCINWQRQFPYVRAWADKYKDQGLVVIGVHSPEFSFEKSLDNVRRESGMLGVTYPVAVDSAHAVWNGFNNRYWPALYFIDAKGRTRHYQFGEGDYDKSEQVIQTLLAEAGAKSVAHGLVSVTPAGSLAQADWSDLKSPESYLGYARAENFASDDAQLDAAKVYTAPAQLQLNQWALAGDWTIRQEFAAANAADGKIVFRFHARDVHLVMGPATDKPVRFRVRIDGKPPGAAHGSDVGADGSGLLSAQRLYQLIRQPVPIADRTFEIEFLDPGAQVFVFTFG
jgi:thiol-disulfide isomerase/thioredoxin